MQFPRRRSEKLSKRDDGPVYLTKDGLGRLEEKLAHFKRILPALIEETQRAAAYGDRSENDEYKEAKSALRRANWQILSIQDQIKRVVVINSGRNASGKVELGSTVLLAIDGTEKAFEIVGSPETDPSRGRISHGSPLGAALIGHKVGDTATIQTGNGAKTYRIIGIR
ncbi:MAG: GreA/GreB family elongation factor [Parcubacteria group bacterium]|nr:GreA/GreB family elongation factor [Parcubacteria group bacterium]